MEKEIKYSAFYPNCFHCLHANYFAYFRYTAAKNINPIYASAFSNIKISTIWIQFKDKGKHFIVKKKQKKWSDMKHQVAILMFIPLLDFINWRNYQKHQNVGYILWDVVSIIKMYNLLFSKYLLKCQVWHNENPANREKTKNAILKWLEHIVWIKNTFLLQCQFACKDTCHWILRKLQFFNYCNYKVNNTTYKQQNNVYIYYKTKSFNF